MFKSVLVVCTGNLCRSPLGEKILQQQMPGLCIESAGTQGVSGHSADVRVQEVASEHGLSLEEHIARKLTRPMMQRFDLILTMETDHINHISSIAPEMRGKTLLFGQWLGKKDIPDPSGKSREAFEYVYNLLVQASHQWATKLSMDGKRCDATK